MTICQQHRVRITPSLTKINKLIIVPHCALHRIAAADVEFAEKRIVEITVAAEAEVEKRLEAALAGQVVVWEGQERIGCKMMVCRIASLLCGK